MDEMAENVAQELGPRAEVTCAIAEHINVAFHQNTIPVVQEIAIANHLGRDIEDVTVGLTSEPAFLVPTAWQIAHIADDVTYRVRVADLRLNAELLLKLQEGVRADVTLVVTASGEEVARQHLQVQLLPPSHWGGSLAAPELLAAFVRPNDPAVDVVLHDASACLAAAGRDSGIDGYRGGRKSRIWELAEAIWSALAARRLTYVLPPASFERAGQKVRGPGDVLERGVGTCLDLSLLYAACIEQAGLYPLVVLTRGHAFVGLWLKEEDFSSTTVEDVQVLRKRRDLDDVVFVETTFLTHNPPPRFAAAVKHAAREVEDGAEAPLEVAIDIRRARTQGIRPLEFGAGNPLPGAAASADPAPAIGMDDVPIFLDELVVREDSEQPLDRLETWKRRLLDLTLRNKLLNFKDAKKAVVIECPDPAELEDRLAAGDKFKLMPRSEVLGDGDRRSAEIITQRHHDDVRDRYIREALGRGELYTGATEKDLDGRLTELYRITRTAFEEGGSNILFLAFGFLHWTQKEGAPACRAPILIVPVALHRSSVRAGFRLALHEDEARINPTLLEMLRQDFQLQMPELEGELPTDASGLDVARIWRIVRTHVRDLKGWEVTEDLVLSTFSFTKFLMWRDLVERMDLLKRNPVVRHLIDTPKQSYGDGTPFPVPARLDVEHSPADIFAPLSADSSQIAAALAAAAGKDFVLFGPPGTGKSQTITNMICQCLAQGKTVLFVSQKTAALEVVQRRLKQIGLGDFCLEVHSAKAQKSSVLGQLKTAWHDRTTPTTEDWSLAAAELQSLRDELNALVSALHRRRNNGMSAYDAFGRLAADPSGFATVELSWTDHTSHTPETLAELRKLCRDANTAIGAVGAVATHPLSGVGATTWSPAWRNDMTAAIDGLDAALPRLRQTLLAYASAINRPDWPMDFTGARSLLLLAVSLNAPNIAAAAPFLGPDDAAIRGATAKLQGLQQRAIELRRALSGQYRDSVFDEDLRRLLDEWQEACAANFVLRSGRMKKARRSLTPFANGDVPDDPGRDLTILIEIAALRGQAQELAPAFQSFTHPFRGLDTDLAPFADSMERADALRATAATIGQVVGGSQALLAQITGLLATDPNRFSNRGAVRDAFGPLQEAWSMAKSAIAQLGELAGLPDPSRPAATGPEWIAQSLATASRWRGSLHLAPAWANWNAVRRSMGEGGLGPLVDRLDDGTLASDDLATAFERAYAKWWSDCVVTDDAVLRGFLTERHEDTIARFKAADERLAEMTKRIVRARIGGDVPLPTAFGADPEWGTLARELTKKARQMPLRRLFSQIPTALTRLTPCVMMSPLSIAQYLPPDAAPFDVVIFDEASQIPVWDAVGAIARGRQVVIVGDPEQLPPTSVGDRGLDEVDDGTDVTDQESILDECLACNIPPLKLSWHYRSRHESLIAFSNKEYYSGGLVTFPSPVTEDLAVRYVHVPGGVYERGSGRVNREEARAVVTDVLRRLSEPGFAASRSSIGIVTFNGEQQRLIENLLDQERRSHPEVEAFFNEAQWHEPVFVKNLENVQGDERDVILFSVAVGPDESGRVAATVSSLNKEGGHRRLNVAITRARRELVVFATLRPEQIDLSRTRARGVRDFKHFLEYAERGSRALAEAFAATGDGTESPFEDAVKAALEKEGWEVHPQIGTSGFRIDLGVVHPDAPGRYLAGVECDGATYHRAATARDRDRLREWVLTDLGWRIRRVWSTEWWMDRTRAFAKLQKTLLEDLDEDRAREAAKADRAAASEAAAVEEEREIASAEELPQALPEPAEARAVAELAPDFDGAEKIARNDAPPVAQALQEGARASLHAGSPAAAVPALQPNLTCPYVVTDFAQAGYDPDAGAFYTPLYGSTLRALVAHVIAVEGPLFEDVLIERIARAHGFARAAGRIRQAVLDAVAADCGCTEEDGRGVLWPPGIDPAEWSMFRDAPSDVRPHTDIPQEELAALARAFIGQGADIEEAVRLMAKHFGLSRLRESTRQRFEAAARGT